jgi:phage-related protein (TIGR01555 family)
MSSALAIADSSILEAVNRWDGWENIITQIGTSADKRSGGRIKVPVRNVNYRQFEDLYFGDDLAATIAELPAREMVREWFDVVADDPALDEDDDRAAPDDEATTEEKVTIGKRVGRELEVLEAQSHVFEALVWARVFGGSLLFLGIDDGGGNDPESLAEPLNEDNILSFDHLTVFDRWDVHVSERERDPSNKDFGRPKFYQINTTTLDGEKALPGDRIHASRFIRFDGTLVNRRRARENNGWADSIYTRLEELIRDYNLAWGSISHILQDFAQAIFKMRGLKDAILSDKDELVFKRMSVIDRFRSTSRAVPLDAESEDFDRKQTPVGGLPELMDRFALRLSAGARQPATLLFGQSPAGLQATGTSDIRFFYDQIAAMQNAQLRPKLERLVSLIFKKGLVVDVSDLVPNDGKGTSRG